MGAAESGITIEKNLLVGCSLADIGVAGQRRGILDIKNLVSTVSDLYAGPERRRSGPQEERRGPADRRKGLERRRGPGRRRCDLRRKAEEGEMTDELLEFVLAIDEYKRINKRPFPTWSEVFEVIRYLGYRKVADRSEHIDRPVDDPPSGV